MQLFCTSSVPNFLWSNLAFVCFPSEFLSKRKANIMMLLVIFFYSFDLIYLFIYFIVCTSKECVCCQGRSLIVVLLHDYHISFKDWLCEDLSESPLNALTCVSVSLKLRCCARDSKTFDGFFLGLCEFWRVSIPTVAPSLMQMRDGVMLFRETLLTFSLVATVASRFPLLHHGLSDRQQLNIARG